MLISIPVQELTCEKAKVKTFIRQLQFKRVKLSLLRSCGKVMFLHLSVILFTGVSAIPPRQTPPTPPCAVHAGVRSTGGRYWNAILFLFQIAENYVGYYLKVLKGGKQLPEKQLILGIIMSFVVTEYMLLSHDRVELLCHSLLLEPNDEKQVCCGWNQLLEVHFSQQMKE